MLTSFPCYRDRTRNFSFHPKLTDYCCKNEPIVLIRHFKLIYKNLKFVYYIIYNQQMNVLIFIQNQQSLFYQIQIYMTQHHQAVHQQNPLVDAFTSSDHLSRLLHHQENFNQVLNTQIYSFADQDNDRVPNQVILKFEILWVTNMNELFTKMLQELNRELIINKRQYDTTIRDMFHKLLNADYLPLLRFSKHQLNQISLFGFDIYIPPLEAILEIINRIDTYQQIFLQQYSKKSTKVKQPKQTTKSLPIGKGAYQNLQRGHQYYNKYLQLWKISFNINMLIEYLKVATKSFHRKQKEIIFTGCNNIFQKLIPVLIDEKEDDNIWLMMQLAQLNNQLYNFHPSFDLAKFYTYFLDPLQDRFQPVFSNLIPIMEKCLATSILTPLLFALMRNYNAIISWIQQIQTQVWIKYLKALQFALLLNFKGRMMEYEQVIQLLSHTMKKLALLGQFQQQQILGDLPTEWNEAKQFFISAIKLGYPVGQIHTWHCINPEKIQLAIINCSIQSILLLKSPSQSQLQFFYKISKGVRNQMEKIISIITAKQLTIEHLTLVNHNIIQTIAKKRESSDTQQCPQNASGYSWKIGNDHVVLWVFRLINLIRLDEQMSTNCNVFYSLAQTALELELTIPKNYCLQRVKLQEILQILSLMIRKVNFEKNQQKFKELVVELYFRFHCEALAQPIFSCLLQHKNKNNSMTIIQMLAELPNKININKTKIYAEIIQGYFPKMSSKQKVSSTVTIKTFQKQYCISIQFIDLPTRLRSCISTIIEILSSQRSMKEKQVAVNLLEKIIKVRPQISLPILMYPTSTGQDKVETFQQWLLLKVEYHQLLFFILKASKNTVNTNNGEDLIEQITLPCISNSIITHINSVLNEGINIVCLIPFLKLFYNLLQLTPTLDKAYYEQILKCYQQILSQIAISSESIDQKYQKLIECLNQYSLILTMKVFQNQKQKWVQFTQISKKYILRFSGEREKTNNAETYQIRNIKSVQNVFTIQDHTTNEDKSIQFIQDTLQNILEILNQQQKLEKITPKQFQSIQFTKNQAEKLQEKQWKERLTFYRKFFIPELCSQLIDYTLNKIINEGELKEDSNHIMFVMLLNPFNCLYSLLWSFENNCVFFVQRIGIIRLLHSHMKKLFQFLNQIQSDKRKTVINNITQSLTLADEYLLASSYQLKEEDINSYENLMGLQFLVAFNLTNWRNFLLNLNNRFLSTNMPSLLLQYEEYVQITNSFNQEYTEQYNKFIQLIKVYERHFNKKIKQILTKDSKSEQEKKCSIVNEISNAKLILQSSRAKEFLVRLGSFNKQLLLRNMQPFEALVDCLHQINFTINSLISGHIMLPDFFQENIYQNQLIVKIHGYSLGQYLENYQQTLTQNSGFQENLSIMLNKYKGFSYIPSQIVEITMKQLTLQYNGFIYQKPIMIKQQSFSQQQIENLRINLLKQLSEKKAIAENNGEIEIIFQNQSLKDIQHQERQGQTSTQINHNQNSLENIYNLMYKLGITWSLSKNKSKNPLDLILKKGSKRQILGWDCLRKHYSEQYHHISSVLANEEIQNDQLCFVYQGKQLLSNGKQIKVTNNNKKLYCNLLGLSCYGKQKIKLYQNFCRGFVYASKK